MIYILYSGDYEVFMGGNYLPETEVVIRPTDAAMDTFDSIGVPVTLFADLLCIWRYRQLGFSELPEQMDQQLRSAIQRGHDVQMHIHPHWPTTSIEKNSDGSTHYDFDFDSIYPGEHMSSIYDVMYEHLIGGKEYLNSLLQERKADYECIAFRAGGYGIGRGSEEMLAAMQDAGYVIDSSIVPELPGTKTPNHPTNFSGAPKLGNYYLSRKGGINKVSSEGIFEIPVCATTVREIGALLRMKTRALKRRWVRNSKPHQSVGYTSGERQRLTNTSPSISLTRRIPLTVKRAVSLSHWGMLDITEDVGAMLDVTKSYVKRHYNKGTNLFFSASFHPKDWVACPGRHDATKQFHGKIKAYFGDELQAITFQQAAELIGA